MRNSQTLNTRIADLSSAEGLMSLGIFDEEKIARVATEFAKGNNGVGSALLSLITIDEFISPTG